MKKITKFLFILCIILFLVSIYNDLTNGTVLQTDLNSHDHQPEKQLQLTAVKVKVQTGDTVLSIVERLSDQDQSMNQQNVSQIMTDFKTLNPDTSPLEVEAGDYYYFPVYDTKQVSMSVSLAAQTV
ncbi:LysM domain-containing protein [Barrientosiimonas marina]|uniref:LysM domain-containing protein n=1 Tax=Lentibacillus kimchii TaxID=1542911 RepID=A0ABW2V0E3_9BACI